jgi:hypothetical protein
VLGCVNSSPRWDMVVRPQDRRHLPAAHDRRDDRAVLLWHEGRRGSVSHGSGRLAVAVVGLCFVGSIGAAQVRASAGQQPRTSDPTATATATPTPAPAPTICLGCVQPSPTQYISISALAAGQWAPARVVFHGEPVMFREAVQLHVRGWRRFRTVVAIIRAVRAQRSGILEPSIHWFTRLRMERGPDRKGYAHFWVRHRFTSPTAIGPFFAEFFVYRPHPAGYEGYPRLFIVQQTGGHVHCAAAWSPLLSPPPPSTGPRQGKRQPASGAPPACLASHLRRRRTS